MIFNVFVTLFIVVLVQSWKLRRFCLKMYVGKKYLILKMLIKFLRGFSTNSHI